MQKRHMGKHFGVEGRKQLEIAIVGGGSAGPYTGWRLLSSKNVKPSEVELFERTSAIGGRFYSPVIGCHKPDDPNSPRTELGGMRIRNTDSLTLGVVKTLGIELGPFNMNHDMPPEDPANNFSMDELAAGCAKNCKDGKCPCSGDCPSSPVFVNGVFTSRGVVGSTLAAVDKAKAKLQQLPYDLTTSDVAFGMAAAGLAFAEGGHNDPAQPSPCKKGPTGTVDPCNHLNAQKYLEQPNYLGVKNYETSLWTSTLMNNFSMNRNMLNNAISGYAGSLGSTTDMNLGVADVAFAPNAPPPIYKPTEYYVRPLTGMQTIPIKMAEAYTKLGGKTHFNSQLLVVEKVADGWVLTFQKTWSSPCTQVTSFAGPEGSGAGETYTVFAKKVVLALTKNALSKIVFKDSTNAKPDEDGLLLPDRIDKLCAAVASASAMKYFASYPKRWWETFAQEHHKNYPNDVPFDVGRVTGSANVNNFFAWYPGVQQKADQPRACANDTDMGVVQAYVTGFADDTWSGALKQQQQLECRETEADQCGKCFNSDTGFVGPAKNHAPQLLEDAMRRELAVLWGLGAGNAGASQVDQIPKATEVMYTIWSNDDPVTQTDAVHYFKAGFKWWDLYVKARSPAEGLSLVGEAMSYNALWIEGALETSEYMLQEVYGLARPSWLTREDYCWAMPYWPLPRRNDGN
jgi:hypothetical protein